MPVLNETSILVKIKFFKSISFGSIRDSLKLNQNPVKRQIKSSHIGFDLIGTRTCRNCRKKKNPMIFSYRLIMNLIGVGWRAGGLRNLVGQVRNGVLYLIVHFCRICLDWQRLCHAINGRIHCTLPTCPQHVQRVCRCNLFSLL